MFIFLDAQESGRESFRKLQLLCGGQYLSSDFFLSSTHTCQDTQCRWGQWRTPHRPIPPYSTFWNSHTGPQREIRRPHLPVPAATCCKCVFTLENLIIVGALCGSGVGRVSEDSVSWSYCANVLSELQRPLLLQAPWANSASSIIISIIIFSVIVLGPIIFCYH